MRRRAEGMFVMTWFNSIFALHERIDDKIRGAIAWQQRQKLIIHTMDLPSYRFVDLSNAVTTLLAGRANVERIETQQSETLNQLVHDPPQKWADRSTRNATKTSWPTGPDEEAYLPIDCFWICPSEDDAQCIVVRLKYEEYYQQSRIELACAQTDAGKDMLNRIVEHSKQNSIYRNKILQLAYETAKKDEYGDVEKPERFQVVFSSIEPVRDQDIVLSEEHLRVLQRNVVDLHTRREILATNGVPARRGVLLHGPPGTGKTFACRHLCHRMPDVTRIFVTGSSLLNVGLIFAFARLFQPSVLFLEDVDLIFSSREINLYSTALGDLLDQMDGLRARENVSVVLTTNAIDRLEAAIKDRPGRISQCIYMGAPGPELRGRFLRHLLANHNGDAVDFDRLVAKSEGATQAFLKEWMHRSVQIACERLDSPNDRAKLSDEDFSAAMAEMRSFLDGTDGKIVGFVGR